MRILHTADWHLNDRLERQDRQPDLLRALDQISRYLDEYKVDVMVVAGDLFSERSTREQWRDAISQIKERFISFVTRGGTIVAISGNHDNEAYFDMLRDALDLASPRLRKPGDLHASGRLYIESVSKVIRLADAQGDIVQFVLMPYPKASLYLRGQGLTFSSLAEKHRSLQDIFKQVLAEMQRNLVDPRRAAVLVSHIHVRGASAQGLYRLSESEDVLFEPGDIPDYAYVAYGHIHRPGPAVPNAEHIRYAGSIERMDLAEREDNKSVVLIDIKGNQRVDLECLPLESTPIYKVEIKEPEIEVPLLRVRYPDAERALVNYVLHWEPGKHNRDALTREIEAIFPRWYSRSLPEVGPQLTQTRGYSTGQLLDVTGNVRRYLDDRLAKDSHRDELMTLAEGLLAEGVDA